MSGTNSAQWSFRHKSVDKQYWFASLGTVGCFLFFAVVCCLIESRV